METFKNITNILPFTLVELQIPKRVTVDWTRAVGLGTAIRNWETFCNQYNFNNRLDFSGGVDPCTKTKIQKTDKK